MKTKFPQLIAVAVIAIVSLLFSCRKEITDPDTTRIAPPPPVSTQPGPCGTPEVINLIAGQNMNAGTITVSNDQSHLYVTYTTVNGWKLVQTHLYAGICSGIPVNNAGNPTIGLFPYQTNHTPNVTSFTYTLPLAGLDSCYCVAAHASLVQVDANGNIIQSQTGWGQGDPIGGHSWAMKFGYCTQLCTSSCTISAGDYRTQTQGGWGAAPQGNNPAMYLQNNFATAFPAGLTIGCSGGYSLHFTSSQAIQVFLPQGGPAAALSSSATDPATVNNVFAGQVAALAISVGLDNAITNFSASSGPLSSLLIASGPFQGWTVNQLLAAANNALGGCSAAYSISDLNAAVTAVNENFDNGTINNNYLVCP